MISYPNLEADEAAKDAYDAVMVSDLEFGSINYKEGCRYIAANKTEVQWQQSDLRRVLPTRQNSGGVRPGPTGEDAMGPHSNDEKLWHFAERVELTDSEKRKVVAEVVAIDFKTILSTHVYSFGGRSVSGAQGQLPG